ncbi:MAG: sigma 54-interacting transcriptional regulator [Pseudomonadota bacterium]
MADPRILEQNPPAAGGVFVPAEGHPILDCIADGVFTVDADWRITSFNRAAEEITGISRDEALGRPCRDVFRASICHSDCALARTVRSGQRLIDVPVEIHDARGRSVPISISTAVLFDRQGQRVGGVETFRDLSDLHELKRQLDQRDALDVIVGRNPRMREVLDLLPVVAQSEATVLVLGPSGTGKGLVARTLHELSARHDKPFVKVNCAALPETLLESELFGYVRGAFTDARQNKPGRIAVAEGGTLFLDEIGDVPPSVQVKLLRVVQEREYEALGSSETKRADVRIIAATNRDLVQRMREGLFREDLYYRLNIVSVQLPALCERRDDIPGLIDHVLKRQVERMGRASAQVSDEALARLLEHDYPGNVRELENALEHALVLSQGQTIEPRHLPASIRDRQPAGEASAPPRDMGPLDQVEANAIRAALARSGGNRAQVAQELGLHRTTLWRKMRKLGLA